MARLPLYLLLVFLGGYTLVFPAFTKYLVDRPIEERLGYLPAKELLKGVAGEHKQSVTAVLMLKVMYYFGGTIDRNSQADYTSMARLIQTANYIDPYSFDLYYLAQAAFPTGVNGATFVNNLIKNGMKYRTWDADLPFYAGYNSAFVLHDFPEAARFLQRASELSGNEIYASLSMKLFNKAGEIDFAIIFVESMIKNASDDKIRSLYLKKKGLLESVKIINSAVTGYKERFGNNPADLQALLNTGFLNKLPVDPFGGKFIITNDGVVETTSGSLSLKGI